MNENNQSKLNKLKLYDKIACTSTQASLIAMFTTGTYALGTLAVNTFNAAIGIAPASAIIEPNPAYISYGVSNLVFFGSFLSGVRIEYKKDSLQVQKIKK